MESRSDVVVIGAGIIGCAVAYELARRGASVQVVDDRAVGMGATQASAGMLAPFIEARDAGPLLTLGARSLELYDDFVGRVRAASGMEVAYRRTGSLDVALDKPALSRLEAVAAALAARGVSATLLDARAVGREEPQLTSSAAGGLLIPTHGFVAAHELTRALALAARRHGAQVLERHRAIRVSRAERNGSDRELDGGLPGGLPLGLIVETEHGPLAATTVVLAAGSWASQIEIETVDTPAPIRPVRGQLLQLACAGPALRRVIWGDRCYLVPWDDGTLLVGATVEEVGFDERTTLAGVRGLIDAACEMIPNLTTAALTSSRAGLRPASSDDLPAIGPSVTLPGLMYATGHYRNGVLLAPLTARLVADAVLDGKRDPLLALTSPQRFGAL